MLPRLWLPVLGQPAKLLILQRKHGPAQLAQSRPRPAASTAAVRRQGTMLPSGRQHGRKSCVVCQAVDSGVNPGMDRNRQTGVELERHLREAVQNHDWKEVADLINAGAPTDLEGGDATLLHYAVEAGELGVVNLLLQHGADLNAEGWGPSPPLAIALFDVLGGWEPKLKAEIDAAIVRALVAAGADPDMYDVCDTEHVHGYTMMHAAALMNGPDVIAMLGEIGADTEVREGHDGGLTPLHVAATNGNVEAVEALLECGADVNARVGGAGWETDDSLGGHFLGSTPLHMAALGYCDGCSMGDYNEFGRAKVASILLAAGADVSARDAKGRTALEVAEYDDVKAVLQAAAAKL